MANEYPMRINKFLAHKGLSTRKEADVLIAKGLVIINGKKAVLGQKVAETDSVEVRGKKRTYRYIAFNKPEGVVTHTPQFGEKSGESVEHGTGQPRLDGGGSVGRTAHRIPRVQGLHGVEVNGIRHRRTPPES